MIPPNSAPLEERTNDSSTCEILSPRPVYPAAMYERSRNLRRIDSQRRILIKSDTDSLPDIDGIYNASPVGSDENLMETKSPMKDCNTFNFPLTELANSPTPVLSPSTQPTNITSSPSLPLSHKSLPLGHSQWPAPHLDTIIEHQSSIRSLRHASSAPRLRCSPERSPKIVKIQDSFHSIRLAEFDRQHWTRSSLHPDTGLHQRSFSLNDLDCLHRLMGVDEAAPCTPISCTSTEALSIFSDRPAYPARPVQPPPNRAPTPPGIPSFGTREAQVIRLAPDGGRRRPRLFSSWLVQSPNESDDRTLTVSSPTTRADASPENTLPSPSEGLLRRLLAASGMSRLVSTPVQDQTERRRASLPPGVFATSELRILALADDGTAVRGRFGQRASGHGIGHRHINSHAFNRVGGHTTIDDTVREIDKACAEMDRELGANHLQSLPVVPYASIDTELHRRLSEVEQNSNVRNEGSCTTDPEFLSPASSGFALPFPTYPYQNLMPIPGPSPSPFPPANSPANTSTAVVATMNEPGDYTHGAGDQVPSIASSRFSQQLRQQRREQQRIAIKHDERLGACKRSCALFCLNECDYLLIEPEHHLNPEPPASNGEELALHQGSHENNPVRQEAHRTEHATPRQDQITANRVTERDDSDALAANPASMATSGAASATSLPGAQLDGTSSLRPRPQMDEPQPYPPQIDDQVPPIEQASLVEWRPQDSPPHWFDGLRYRTARPDPVYDGPPTPRTREILARRDQDRARGFNPYEAELTRIVRKSRATNDLSGVGVSRSDYYFGLRCFEFPRRVHNRLKLTMPPEYVVTKPYYYEDGFDTTTFYPKAWRPRHRLWVSGSENPNVPHEDPVSPSLGPPGRT